MIYPGSLLFPPQEKGKSCTNRSSTWAAPEASSSSPCLACAAYYPGTLGLWILVQGLFFGGCGEILVFGEIFTSAAAAPEPSSSPCLACAACPRPNPGCPNGSRQSRRRGAAALLYLQPRRPASRAATLVRPGRDPEPQQFFWEGPDF